MTESLRITCSDKDDDGDIINIGNPSSWGKHSITEAIDNIKKNPYAYHVLEDNKKVYLEVCERNGKEYIRTKPDSTGKNNLDNLTSC